MTEQAAQQPEDARPARVELWHRLLAGQVTEVYVAGLDDCVRCYLPQTLGLEPIYYRAYFYDREGMPTTRDELARIARQLAAERRWIAGGGAWYWDREFAARAQAIVLFDLYDRWAHGRVDNDMGFRQRLVIRREAARARRESGRSTEEDAWRVFLDYAVPAAAKGSLTSMEEAVVEVRERHRDKTFVVVDPEDRRRLRDVRAAPNG